MAQVGWVHWVLWVQSGFPGLRPLDANILPSHHEHQYPQTLMTSAGDRHTPERTGGPGVGVESDRPGLCSPPSWVTGTGLATSRGPWFARKCTAPRVQLPAYHALCTCCPHGPGRQADPRPRCWARGAGLWGSPTRRSIPVLGACFLLASRRKGLRSPQMQVLEMGSPSVCWVNSLGVQRLGQLAFCKGARPRRAQAAGPPKLSPESWRPGWDSVALPQQPRSARPSLAPL